MLTLVLLVAAVGQSQSFNGVVLRVDADERDLIVEITTKRDAAKRTFAVPAAAKIVRDSKPATFAALKPKDAVVVIIEKDKVIRVVAISPARAKDLEAKSKAVRQAREKRLAEEDEQAAKDAEARAAERKKQMAKPQVGAIPKTEESKPAEPAKPKKPTYEQFKKYRSEVDQSTTFESGTSWFEDAIILEKDSHSGLVRFVIHDSGKADIYVSFSKLSRGSDFTWSRFRRIKIRCGQEVVLDTNDAAYDSKGGNITIETLASPISIESIEKMGSGAKTFFGIGNNEFEVTEGFVTLFKSTAKRIKIELDQVRKLQKP